MQHVYISAISGYEDENILGVYSDLNVALERAKEALEEEKKFSNSFYNAFAIKAEIDGKLISCFCADGPNGEISETKMLG